MTGRTTALLLPAADLGALRERVRLLAENRPGVYRMLDPLGRVVYVGKARRVRARLLSYFRAEYPEDKAARILHAAANIEWEYAPSEFAALLGELRQIRRFRPQLNFKMNRTRRAFLVKVSGGQAPKVYTGTSLGGDDVACFGPFRSHARVAEGVRMLNDLLGLRDCAVTMPIVYSGQTDLFDHPQQAACLRHDFGFCAGPCAGFVTRLDYLRRVQTAVAFLEGRTIDPIPRAVASMQEAAEAARFEQAARWREKYEALEWLLAAAVRARSAVDLLSFVYRDAGVFGDDRVYLVRRGTVRATFPYPVSPIEEEAFRAVVREELARPEKALNPLAPESLDEVLLVMGWFRKHPDAFRRTTKFAEWT